MKEYTNSDLLKKGNYASILGLQCERNEEELKDEKERYVVLNKEIMEDYRKLKRKCEYVQSQIRSIDYGLEYHRKNRLRNIEPTDEHLKLLNHIEFVGGGWGEIKNNGGMSTSDVARILDWKLPNSDLSDEQTERAIQLLAELPFVLNKILT